MSDSTTPTRVAIACQGSGSHTAFTAGVLQEILSEWDETEYDLVGISGTSGESFTALATWYGLLTGGPDTAAELLDGIWDDISANGAQDRWLNTLVPSVSRMDSAGFAIPSVSPSQIPLPGVGKRRIRTVLERHIDFEEIPGLCQRDAPELVVVTVNVNAGIFETFVNEDVTVKAVLPRLWSICSRRSKSTVTTTGTACSRRTRPSAT